MACRGQRTGATGLRGARARSAVADPASRPPGATLALRVLRRLAGALQAVLLALLHPRVAGEEAGLPQRQAVRVRVDLEEGPGDAVADRTGLAGHPAALDLDHGVEVALGAGDAERHPDIGLVHG